MKNPKTLTAQTTRAHLGSSVKPSLRAARASAIHQHGTQASAVCERERGYTLVALLALMTILMLSITAAAPSIRQQKQRELELEAIARGEEVAEAIHLYLLRNGNQPPTSMEQLLEGLPFGTKKVQILRLSATRDPLSSTGEWRLIRLTDPEMIEFKDAVTEYAGNRPVITWMRDNGLKTLAAPILNMTSSNRGKDEPAPGGEVEGTNTGGPFVGVASRSRRASVVTYYGIERHDKWIFTPLFR